MKKRILILGGAGYSEIVASVVDKLPDMELVGFVNDFVEVGALIGDVRKIPVVMTTNSVPDALLKDPDLYVIHGYNGVTNPWKSYARLQQLERLIPSERWATVIDPSAVIPFDYCKIGYDVFVGPLAQTSTNVTLCNHCALMGGSFVGHNSVIGEFSHITAKATVTANVKIGRCALIGPNSAIRGNTTIGDGCIVGLGSVVLHDVEEGCVVAGNPAKFLKKREDCKYGVGTPQYVDMNALNIDKAH